MLGRGTGISIAQTRQHPVPKPPYHLTFMSVYSIADPAKLQLPSLYPKRDSKFEPWEITGEQMVHESCLVFLSTESFLFILGTEYLT